MKHTVKQIDKYYNVNGREVIDFTTIKGLKYSVERQNGQTRGFVCVNNKWSEMGVDMALETYDYIVDVIRFEIQREKMYEKEKKKAKDLQGAAS